MIDVIIPVYKPGNELIELIENLKKQTVRPNKIILMNTEKAYFDKMLENTGYVIDESLVEVHHIDKSDFDHGRTRNEGISYSGADIFILMTQDALPVNDEFIMELTGPLENTGIAASYARQEARESSGMVEKITREFNYPKEALIKTEADRERLGIKTYFCSNVSCAYVRSIYDSLGGFVNRIIFNEDMIFAAKAVKAGYAISYSAKARVYHSHKYTAMQQFHRNVDLGVSQADHPEVFLDLSSESEGKKYVLGTIGKLWRLGYKREIIPYIYSSGWKFIGYKIGVNYKKLPLWFVKECSMNKEYFGR